MNAQRFKTKIEKLLLGKRLRLLSGFIDKEVIRKNSIKNLKILVDLNINLNEVIHCGQTFLHLCCIPAEGAPPGEPFDTRRCELIRFLIAKGANVNAKNEDGDTPLAFALKNKYFAVVKFLVLNYDVDVNLRDDYGRAPLHNLMRNYKFHIEDENLLARFLELGFNINSQDNHGNSILHYACIYQEADVIEFLIRNGADVNLKNSDNYSPLHFVLSNIMAINHNRNSEIGRLNSSTLQVIQVLLRYNADVNAVDNRNRTALYYACCEGIVEAVQLLLKSGANPNVFDIDEYTPIMKAYDSLTIIKCLVDYKADVNAKGDANKTILHIACDYGKVEVVKFLLENGADPNAIDTQGITPTMKAVDNLPIVKHLLNYNADVNMVDNRNETALHYACSYGNVKVVQLLLESGANPNALDIDQYTPIMKAFHTLVIIKCLVDYNANVNARNNRNETILHIACRRDDVEIVEFLLENGADPNVIDAQGITPTIIAVIRDHLPIVKHLLNYNADVDTVNKRNETALHYACCYGNVEVIQLLLESGANPNALDIDQYSSIMRFENSLVIIKCLVDYNANVNARNNRNETILHFACSRDDVEVVKFLLENGADPNVIDFEGFTPILRAASHLLMSSKVKLVKCLLDFNADVYAQNNDGETLLHFASRCRCVDVVKFVLHRHFDMIYMNNKLGKTALHLANSAGNHEIVKILLDYGADTQKMDKDGIIPMRYNVDTLNRYIIKMKCVGRILKIDPELYNELIYEDDDDGGQSNKFIGFDVNYFKAKCNAQIEAMKTAKVGDSNVTLHDLLMNGYRGIVANIFGYEELITILENYSYRLQFSLYIDMVLGRVAESRMRRELLDTAENCVFTGIFKNLPYDCVRKIFGYLNVREIKLFLNAQRLEDVEEK